MGNRLSRRALVAGILTVPLMADQPLAAPQDRKIDSLNKRFYALLDAKKKTTTAYRRQDKSKLWETPGWFRVAFLADDGEHLVTGYDGVNLIPVEYDRKMAMLTFYRQGKPFRTVTLEELVPDLTKLRNTASHWSWGHYAGMETGYLFRVDTVDRGTLHFDLRTGEIVKPGPAKK